MSNTPITEEMVEAGAKAAWDVREKREGGTLTWESVLEHRNVCEFTYLTACDIRDQARAAITAALQSAADTPAPAVAFHCDICGRPTPCDTIVSNEDWARVSPTNDEGGMLCAACMVDRLGYVAAKIVDAHVEADTPPSPYAHGSSPQRRDNYEKALSGIIDEYEQRRDVLVSDPEAKARFLILRSFELVTAPLPPSKVREE